jgi:hypothetical protein
MADSKITKWKIVAEQIILGVAAGVVGCAPLVIYFWWKHG